MKPNRILLVVAVAVLSSCATPGFQTHEAHLDGAQEVPPTPSMGTGYARITLNTEANTVRVVLSFKDLLSPQTMAHIHGPAPEGQNAGVLVGFPTGNFDQTFPVTDAIEEHIQAGLTYINVHTTMFPGGEIRGQIEELYP